MATESDLPPNGQGRRKERTRAALLLAARRLLEEGRHAHASIQTITDLAAVGFGSFHNHFTSKEQLFAEASDAAVDEFFAWIDDRLPPDADPVTRLLESVRLTGRLVGEQPQIAAILGQRVALLDDRSDPRRRRIEDDIRAAMSESGARPGSMEFGTLVTASLGAILAVIRRALSLTPDETVEAADVLADAVLRILSVPRSGSVA